MKYAIEMYYDEATEKAMLYLIELCGFEVVEIFGGYHKSKEDTGNFVWILRKAAK